MDVDHTTQKSSDLGDSAFKTSLYDISLEDMSLYVSTTCRLVICRVATYHQTTSHIVTSRIVTSLYDMSLDDMSGSIHLPLILTFNKMRLFTLSKDAFSTADGAQCTKNIKVFSFSNWKKAIAEVVRCEIQFNYLYLVLIQNITKKRNVFYSQHKKMIKKES